MTEGIPYFSLDCQFDDKLEEIEDAFGMKGLGIIIKLFQKIYGIHGYYCEWNNGVASRFAKREAFVGTDVVHEVVAAALRESKNHESLFDREMYAKYGILTSRGIQKRYLKAAKSMKRKDIFPIPEYVIIPFENSNSGNSGKSTDNSSLNEMGMKVNEMGMGMGSNAAPQPAPLPDRKSLVWQYGERAVKQYELKYQDWQQRKGVYGGISYTKIAEWMLQDGVPDISEKSKANEELMERIRAQYQ